MFYFTTEGWKVFKKKITFARIEETYDDNDEAYVNDPSCQNVISESLVLTDEQLRRLETIKEVGSMGVEDVKKYVFDAAIEDENLIEMKKEVKEEEIRQKLSKFVRWDELTTDQMIDLADDFKDYHVGTFYIAGDVFNYSGQLYKVISSHTSQLDWVPVKEPSLYLAIAPPGVIEQWTQPIGAHDTYRIGVQVKFGGQTYESLIDYNAYSPDTYPEGWSLVQEEIPVDPGVPEVVIGPWVQPTGAHDAYNIGDKVTFGGKVYESVINANTYSPTAYPAGWKLVV